MLIAQITDMHIYEPGVLAFGAVDTAARLAACVRRINGLERVPDLVIATGDLVDSGSPAQYRNLRKILAPLISPLFVIPGNHDARENLRNAFDDLDFLPSNNFFLHYAIEDFPVRIVAADTIIEGEPGGIMDAPRIHWLSKKLAEDRRRPTILAMHHPPFPTGIVHMDRMGCRGADELAAVIAENPQVERIICGHVHRAIQSRFAHTVAMIAPSTAFQVALDFDPEAPARWTDEPTAFMLHYWDENSGLSSHIVPVADPGPKRPFRMAD
ncbi:MAG: phosphodiesterase [Alphaproteobacteria bacterium]